MKKNTPKRHTRRPIERMHYGPEYRLLQVKLPDSRLRIIMYMEKSQRLPLITFVDKRDYQNMEGRPT